MSNDPAQNTTETASRAVTFRNLIVLTFLINFDKRGKKKKERKKERKENSLMRVGLPIILDPEKLQQPAHNARVSHSRFTAFPQNTKRRGKSLQVHSLSTEYKTQRQVTPGSQPFHRIQNAEASHSRFTAFPQNTKRRGKSLHCLSTESQSGFTCK